MRHRMEYRRHNWTNAVLLFRADRVLCIGAAFLTCTEQKHENLFCTAKILNKSGRRTTGVNYFAVKIYVIVPVWAFLLFLS